MPVKRKIPYDSGNFFTNSTESHGFAARLIVETRLRTFKFTGETQSGIKLTIITISLFLIFSCKKSVEIREIQIDKKYSWTEIKRFTGTEKIFLSSGSNADAIYLQQPYFFTELRSQNINTGINPLCG